MIEVKSNALANQAITTGIPLVLVAAAAYSLGISLDSWTTIAMAALASVLQTVFTHFTLLPRRSGYAKRGQMGTYYNYWAAISALSSLAAIALVHAAVK